MPIRAIGHHTGGDVEELLFESIQDCWMLLRNVVRLSDIRVKVIQFESFVAAGFDGRDPRLLKAVQL